MNKGTKVTVGLGAFMLIIGILAMVMGAGAVGEADEWRPTDDAYLMAEKDNNISFLHVEEGNGDRTAVFVTDDVRCDDFTLEISGGDAYWKADECIEKDGRSLPSGSGDDPEGWLHLGTIHGLEDGKEYTISTSHDVVLVGWEVIDEIIGSFFAGLAGICGGPTFLCCGLLFLLIGIGIAFTQKGEEKTYTKIEIDQAIDVLYDKQE